MRLRSALLLVACLFPFSHLFSGQQSFGQQVVCEGQEGEAALQCIQESYSPSGTIGYGPARDTLYAKIDSGTGGELVGIYSGYSITLAPGEDPSEDAFENGINAEHVYPQSKGAGTEPRKSDMHNLHLARIEVNSARGNLPLGESSDTQTSAWYFEDSTRSAIPGQNINAWSERLEQSGFEPREAKEGDIARAALYFYAVYRSAADDTFFEGMREELVQWAEADPPTDAERDRSSAIAERQGNENPFVLDTTLVGRAFSEGGGEDLPPGQTPSSEALFISELSDAEGDFTTEFFEIYNDSTAAVDLAEIDGKIVQDLRNGDQVYTFDFGDDEAEACETTVAEAKGTLVVARGATKEDFEAEWGPFPEGAGFCAFNQNSFFPGTDERSWELRAGGTAGEPDGKILGETPQFDNMGGSRAYQDLSLGSPWQQQEPITDATPGELDEGQVLPVELASFNGTTIDKNLRLTWKTASEQNNAGFEVQRKEESGWNRVGYVESKAGGGTTTEAKSYQFVATGLSVGTHQFRLKQVDLDGSAVIHGPISARVQMQEVLKLTAPAPNPVSSTAILSFAVKGQARATVAVYDMLGRRTATLFEGRPTAGESTRLRLDASGLPSGPYIIQLRADGQAQTQRMTVVR
jgi:hypothetical protein